MGLGNKNGFGDKATTGGGGGSGEVPFASDFPVQLPSGQTWGKWKNGQTVNATGKLSKQVIIEACFTDIDPAFTSFAVTGQSQTVEVGTTLSGSKTFTWGINLGSGTVANINLFDVNTAANILATTPNDGTQAATINTIQLNSDGASQAWRGVGINTTPAGNFNSADFIVMSRFLIFQGATAANPTNSATTRALPANQFYTGAGYLVLSTGNVEKKFAVALPLGKNITLVKDRMASFADITSQYVLAGTVSVTDNGGTARTYNLYVMTMAIPYGDNHDHEIYFN